MVSSAKSLILMAMSFMAISSHAQIISCKASSDNGPDQMVNMGSNSKTIITTGDIFRKDTYRLELGHTVGSNQFLSIGVNHNKNKRRITMKLESDPGGSATFSTTEDANTLSVTCSPQITKQPVIPATGNLVCTGNTNLVVEDEQTIEFSKPLSEVVDDESITLTSAVSIEVSKARGTLVYRGSLDPDLGPQLYSEVPLYSPSRLRGSTGLDKIDVTCSIK